MCEIFLPGMPGWAFFVPSFGAFFFFIIIIDGVSAEGRLEGEAVVDCFTAEEGDCSWDCWDDASYEESKQPQKAPIHSRLILILSIATMPDIYSPLFGCVLAD